MIVIRYAIPAVIVLAGIVIMALGGESNVEGGAGVVSAGLAVWFLNWLFRTGTAGDREREAEDAAREYYDTHGRWPD
jgi:high-affinity Fe2+/Pb2+ permease